MQIPKTKRVTRAWVTELNRIVPELVDLGENWETAGALEEEHQHRYWELGLALQAARLGTFSLGYSVVALPGKL